MYAVDAGDTLARELQSVGLQPTAVVEYRALDTRNVATFRERASSELQPQGGTERTVDPSYWMKMHAPLPPERAGADYREQPRVHVTVAVFDPDKGADLSKLYELVREHPDRIHAGFDGKMDYGVCAFYAENAERELADALNLAQVVPDEIRSYDAIDLREPGVAFPQLDDLEPAGRVHELEPSQWIREQLRWVDPEERDGTRDFIRQSYAHDHLQRATTSTASNPSHA